MKKISVIIPCYNVERYIDRCVLSVILQTIGMENLEIIMVDDASTDHTWAHLQVWEQQYPDHVLLIRQEVNRRQGAARNLGLQYASADWIAFLDADDWLEPDYLELLYRPTTQYTCDVVCCGDERDCSDTLAYFDEEKRKDGEDYYIVVDKEEIRKEVIATWFLGGGGPCGKLVRRDLLTDYHILFPEDVAYEDRYWYPMMHIYASKIYIVGQKLYHYFVNGQSTVSTRNAEHHMDWITVWMMKWAEYGRRGLLEKYRAELEFDCIEDALGVLKTLILRYDQPSFSVFCLERELLREYVPDYRANPYIERLPGIYPVLLEMMYQEPFGKTDFYGLVEYAKKQWKID